MIRPCQNSRQSAHWLTSFRRSRRRCKERPGSAPPRTRWSTACTGAETANSSSSGNSNDQVNWSQPAFKRKAHFDDALADQRALAHALPATPSGLLCTKTTVRYSYTEAGGSMKAPPFSSRSMRFSRCSATPTTRPSTPSRSDEKEDNRSARQSVAAGSAKSRTETHRRAMRWPPTA